MATQPDRDDFTFDQIDWDKVQSGRNIGISLTTIAQLGTFGVIAVALLRDYFIIENTKSTINITNVPGLNWFKWDILSVEWLFLVTCVLIVFNIAIPLYQNKRLTAYYWRQYKKNKMAVVGLVFLGIVVLVGLVGPALIKEPQVNIDTLQRQLRPPVYVTADPTGESVTGTWKYPLGTDGSGIDMVKWIVFGTRVSLEVGLIATMLSVSIGTIVGATAAHMGGMVDEVLMRYVDLQATCPTFLLLILLIYLYGGSLFLLIMLFGFFSWEGTARLVRSEALQRTEEEYVQAAEAAGASQAWIIRRHIIPNVSSTVITNATLSIPAFILSETTLSFLGFADDSIYSWGQIIASGQGLLVPEFAWWVTFFPGLVLFLTVLAFNYVGDAINDAVDPRRDKE